MFNTFTAGAFSERNWRQGVCVCVCVSSEEEWAGPKGRKEVVAWLSPLLKKLLFLSFSPLSSLETGSHSV